MVVGDPGEADLVVDEAAGDPGQEDDVPGPDGDVVSTPLSTIIQIPYLNAIIQIVAVAGNCQDFEKRRGEIDPEQE